MSEASPTMWSGLDAFLAEDPRRRSAEPISYGSVAVWGPQSRSEKWELLWFPETGELVEHRAEAEPSVRLVGHAPHRDYIDAAIADFERFDKDAQVHHRRSEVTHAGETSAGQRPGWRSKSGSSGLRDVLASWKELMDGEFVDDVNQHHPLDDWGHTVDHVDGPFKLSGEAWNMLVPTAVAAVNEALQLERELRGQFNLAAVANLASDLRVSAELLHRALLEAYGIAHRSHPGHHADS